jgi:hypothetical protein
MTVTPGFFLGRLFARYPADTLRAWLRTPDSVLGWTPLLVCAYQGHLSALRSLLAAPFVEEPSSLPESLLEARSQAGNTALGLAALKNRPDIVLELMLCKLYRLARIEDTVRRQEATLEAWTWASLADHANMSPWRHAIVSHSVPLVQLFMLFHAHLSRLYADAACLPSSAARPFPPAPVHEVDPSDGSFSLYWAAEANVPLPLFTLLLRLGCPWQPVLASDGSSLLHVLARRTPQGASMLAALLRHIGILPPPHAPHHHPHQAGNPVHTDKLAAWRTWAVQRNQEGLTPKDLATLLGHSALLSQLHRLGL